MDATKMTLDEIARYLPGLVWRYRIQAKHACSFPKGSQEREQSLAICYLMLQAMIQAMANI